MVNRVPKSYCVACLLRAYCVLMINIEKCMLFRLNVCCAIVVGLSKIWLLKRDSVIKKVCLPVISQMVLPSESLSTDIA